ncbi:MAG: adenosylcobinamide-phosphate synthase CbiB [Elusimicrobiota bacterium]|nr:adenosylcobinamide-phosphate synthase CbiB [Elusimicrobiota bacterium]
MANKFFCIVIAYIADLIFGDPRWFPHPVKLIGKTVEILEIFLRKIFKNKKTGGAVLAFLIIGGTFYVTFLIVKLSTTFNFYFGVGISTFLIYTSLSVKDLKVEGLEVYRALKKNDLNIAREKLSMLVGRDTKNLNEREIIRATVETIAESIVDGIISPLFYALIGGPVLALTYKSINTLDSMVGYNNKKYKDFGWCSAKIDTIANFMPAILSIFLIPLSSLFCKCSLFSSFKIIFRDGLKNRQISNIPESAVAGALGIRLGGINFYNSVAVIKPFLGDNYHPLDKGHIKKSIKIAYISSGLFLTVGLVLLWLIKK